MDPEEGASYYYDAVISIRIGACAARQASNKKYANDVAHLRASNTIISAFWGIGTNNKLPEEIRGKLNF